MAEVVDRHRIEAAARRELNRISRNHRLELRRLIGDPPSADNVPDSFWQRVRSERKEAVRRLLVASFAESSAQHGRSVSDSIQDAQAFADDRSTNVAASYTENARSRARLNLSHTGDSGKAAGHAISEASDEQIAITETTQGQTAGSENAIARAGAKSPEDTWVTEKDARVCPICAPLHDKKRESWQNTFRFGPPAHIRCRCWVHYKGRRGAPHLGNRPEPFPDSSERSLQDATVDPLEDQRRQRRAQSDAEASLNRMSDAADRKLRADAEAEIRRRMAEAPEAKSMSRFDVEDGGVDHHAENLKAMGLTPKQVSQMVGAPPDANVEYAVTKLSNGGQVRVKVFHPDFQASREINVGGKSKVITNNSLDVAEQLQGQGTGLRVFTNQVNAASAAGVKSIDTLAAKGANVVGYKVWPKMGYDAPIPAALKKSLPANLQGAQTVLDLYERPGGEAWWSKNGSTIHMEFDLTKGSRSRRVLEAYSARKTGVKHLIEAKRPLPPQRRGEENLDIGADDETALDRLWAEIRTARVGSPFQVSSTEERQQIIREFLASGAAVQDGQIVGLSSIDTSISGEALRSTQDWLNSGLIQNLMQDSRAIKPVQVIKYRDSFFIWDGHHRAAAAALTGNKVPAKVYTLKHKVNVDAPSSVI